MNLSIRTIVIGLGALVIAAPCWASAFSVAVRQAAGVNVNLAAQVAEVVRTPVTTHEVPQAAAAPGQTIAVVTAGDRDKLLQSINVLTESSAKNASTVGTIVMVLVATAIALGVAASIAGFCKKSTLAGILSILATAIVGANNALPFRDEANNYKYVSAEASALRTRVNLDLQITQDDYNKYTDQLTKLATYGDETSAAGSIGDLEKLLQDLHAAGAKT